MKKITKKVLFLALLSFGVINVHATPTSPAELLRPFPNLAFKIQDVPHTRALARPRSVPDVL